MLASPEIIYDKDVWSPPRQHQRRVLATAALTGAGGVGKSTVLNGVAAAIGRGCVCVEEAARPYFEGDRTKSMVVYDPALGDRYSCAVQHQIQIRHLNRMINGSARTDAILNGDIPFYWDITRVARIDDRTPFDAAFCVASTGDTAGAEWLFENAVSWVGLNPYDHLYVLDPAGVPFANDAVRTEALEERDHHHQTCLRFFDEHGIRYTLLGGTEEERIAAVVNGIEATWAAAATGYPA